MSRLLLFTVLGSALALMWGISALANFVRSYTLGGGVPIEMLAGTINEMALIFGAGGLAADMLKASAIILVGTAFALRRWGVAFIALVLWLPAQAYSAYSVTGFVAQVMGETIAKREQVAKKAKLAARTAEVDVERLSWLSKQSVKGRGGSARRARSQFNEQYREQRTLAQQSAQNLDKGPVAIAGDPAAKLWHNVFRSWSVEDISTASMIGLSLVIELAAGLGFFLMALAANMKPKPKEVAQKVKTKPKKGGPPPGKKEPTNVVDLTDVPRHVRGFRQHLQASARGVVMTQDYIGRSYRAYCREHNIENRLKSGDLRDMLVKLGMTCTRHKGAKSRQVVYDMAAIA